MSRPLLFRLFTAALALVAALTLAELSLRLFRPWVGRHSDTMFQVIEFDARLGWRMRPGIQASVDFVDREGIAVRSNRWGFWDGAWEERGRSGRCRVACLGDSFTWGLGVSRQERFSDRLASLDAGLEVMNFGMPGYGSDQALLTWRHLARRFRPEVVVLTVFENDFADNLFSLRNGRAKPYFRLAGEELRLENPPVPDVTFWTSGVLDEVAPPYRHLYPRTRYERNRAVHWLAKNSDVARLLYTLSRMRRPAPNRVRASPPDWEAPPPAAGSLEGTQVRVLTTLLDRLHREVREAGASLVVVLAGEALPQLSASRVWLAAREIPVVSATTEALAGPEPGEPVYYRFNRHWTPGSHDRVARLLAARLEALPACRPNLAGPAGGAP